MSVNESSEREKQEFLNYLNQHGVMDKLTDVLLLLFNEPEQPVDAVDYVRKNMCGDNPDAREIAKMTDLIENARVKLAELQIARDDMKAKLEQFETIEADAARDTEENGEVRLLEDDDNIKEVDSAMEKQFGTG